MEMARVLIVALIGACLCVAQEVSSPESQDTTLWSQMAQQQQLLQQMDAPVQPTTGVQDTVMDSNSNTDTTDAATDPAPDTQGPLVLPAETVLPADGAGSGLSPMGGVGVMGLSQTESEGLKAHNKYRAWHYAAALTWDSTLASKAQSWANNCKYKYDSTTTYGDNYWAGTSTSSVNAILTAVESWYYQQTYYPTKNTRASDIANVRQFAQLVWKPATKVGCAVKLCNSQYYYVVCRYNKRASNLVGVLNANIGARDTLEAGGITTVKVTAVNAEGIAPSATTVIDIYGVVSLRSQDWRVLLEQDNFGGLRLTYQATPPTSTPTRLWYNNVDVRKTPPMSLILGLDGNLKVVDSAYPATKNVWDTNMFGTAGKAVVKNDGDFVVYASDNTILWNTFTKVPTSG